MSRGGKRKGAGRPNGARSKISKSVRENTLIVFERIGGVGGFAEWAQENKTEFYKHFVALRGSDPDALGTPDNPLQVILNRGDSKL
jgi:hypothetical protein